MRLLGFSARQKPNDDVKPSHCPQRKRRGQRRGKTLYMRMVARGGARLGVWRLNADAIILVIVLRRKMAPLLIVTVDVLPNLRTFAVKIRLSKGLSWCRHF